MAVVINEVTVEPTAATPAPAPPPSAGPVLPDVGDTAERHLRRVAELVERVHAD